MKGLSAVFLMLGLGLGGCASYTYEGMSYSSREAARDAAQRDIDRNVSGVAAAPRKIGGKLVVVIPTREVIEVYGVRRQGYAPPDTVGYIADVLELAFLGVADAVRKSQLFDTVTVLRFIDTQTELTGAYDYKLWLYTQGLDRWQWYLSKNGSDGREPVTPDRGFQKSEYLNSFNSMLTRAGAILLARSGGQPGRPGPRPSGNKGEVVSVGTGFFINGGGFALTNNHVVEGCGGLRAVLKEGENPSVTLVATDRENDMALIKVPSHIGSYALFRAAPPMRQGEPVVTYGYPMRGILASHGNVTTGVVSALAGIRDDSGVIQISAPVQPGNSGGPVLDAGGSVVGIVSSGLEPKDGKGHVPQNINFAVKVNMVTNFLDINNVNYETTTLKKEMPTADIGDRAKGFTFVVQCVE